MYLYAFYGTPTPGRSAGAHDTRHTRSLSTLCRPEKEGEFFARSPGRAQRKELLQSNLHGSNVRTRNPRFTLLSPAPRSVLPREGGICARSMRARSSARGAPRKKRELLPTRTQPGRGLASERSTQPRTSARRTRRRSVLVLRVPCLQKGHSFLWTHVNISNH